MFAHLKPLKEPARILDEDVRSATIRVGIIASLFLVMALPMGEWLSGFVVVFEVMSLGATGLLGLAIARYGQNKGHRATWGLLALFGPIGGVMAARLPVRSQKTKRLMGLHVDHEGQPASRVVPK